MNETEWLGSDNPAMLHRRVVGPRETTTDIQISDRKLRLWVDACRVTIGRDFAAVYDLDSLAILADALEEAGCDSEELLRHLRGWGPCRHCLGTRRKHRAISADLSPCDQCSAEHHGWHRLPGPHVRGCWAVDLLLGKE